jgi:hypothetical protein
MKNNVADYKLYLKFIEENTPTGLINIDYDSSLVGELNNLTKSNKQFFL